MKKNGFTLIELLAVIVILAIIALIATPIILGIINDAREKANERSVELYASAVRNGIASYQLTHLNAPTKFSDLNVNYEGDVVCEKEELYLDGSFYLEGCTINKGKNKYNYGTKQENTTYLNDVCDPVNIAVEGAYTMGDEYSCNPGDGQKRTFYLLEDGDNTVIKNGMTSSNEVTLIMDSDIVEEIEWLTVDRYITAGGQDLSNDDDACQHMSLCVTTEYGPLTALEALQEATKNWEVKVNMPTKEQISAVSYGNFFNYPWLGSGYWVSSYDSGLWAHWISLEFVPANPSNEKYGVRPVITLPKK